MPDFRNVADWDPSMEPINLPDGEPRETGARFRVKMKFP